MSRDSYSRGPIVGNPLTFSPSPTRMSNSRSHNVGTSGAQVSETDPLLGTAKKPFYRPRPLWLVPFAITASVVRGMTLAPRVQVFTQLSCNQLYHHQSHNLPIDYSLPPVSDNIYADTTGSYHLLSFDPLSHVPPGNTCASDPAVQSRAARLQTIMMTTMGIMSALTTGWWGHFGERHGRTRVLAASTLGLLITDFAFYLLSTPNNPWERHAQIVFVVAPFFEGLLGGWTTLQAATSAYISDCTSDGSRAQIFSRMSGVLFLGLAIGPTIGAFLMHHPIFSARIPGVLSMTSVFEVAVFCSAVNLVLLFVYPESLNAKRVPEVVEESDKHAEGFFMSLISPLGIFLPKEKTLPSGRKRKDWSFPLLALGLFAALFSMGIYQIKYLYAQHIYHWSAEHLSYYISLLGGLRAVYLLIIMPFLISTFKPKQPAPPTTGPKPQPTPAQLMRSIKFDLTLLRFSLMVDVISHLLVVLSSEGSSEMLFVIFTALPSMGSGSLPAANSLALSMMKSNGDTGTGRLFGAFAMLQAVGQMIIGPLMFGMVYSLTVGTYPKAIFVMAFATGFIALLFVFLINPRVPKQKGRASLDIERGRSRVSKDLRSGLGHVPDNV